MDDKQFPLFGKEPSNILQLIEECVTQEPGTHRNLCEETAILLDQCLNATVVPHQEMENSLTGVLKHVHREICAQSGPTLKMLLTDSTGTLALLGETKDAARKSAADSSSKAEHRVATTIYFASLASAIVFFHENISSLGHDALKKSLKMLIEKPWMDKDLALLFSRAVSQCDAQMEATEE